MMITTAKIIKIIARLLSLDNTIGIGPISITPPALVFDFMGLVTCLDAPEKALKIHRKNAPNISRRPIMASMLLVWTIGTITAM